MSSMGVLLNPGFMVRTFLRYPMKKNTGRDRFLMERGLMAIVEQKLMLNDVPALIVFEEHAPRASRRGTVILLHGLFACKEGNVKELRSLARHGFLAVGLDAPGHGEREDPELVERLRGDRDDGQFASLLREAAAEIPGVIDELSRRNLIQGGIGITGISMGGYISFAVAQDSRIQAAIPILGSPVWPGNPADSPHRLQQLFPPTAMLVQNAGRDRSVPPHHAREFVRQLQPAYQTCPERLKYIEYENSEHFMQEEDWYRLWNRSLEWFSEYL